MLENINTFVHFLKSCLSVIQIFNELLFKQLSDKVYDQAFIVY